MTSNSKTITKHDSELEHHDCPLEVHGDFVMLKLIEKKYEGVMLPESGESQDYSLFVVGMPDRLPEEVKTYWMYKNVLIYNEKQYIPFKLTNKYNQTSFFMLVKFDDICGVFKDDWQPFIIKTRPMQPASKLAVPRQM